MAKITVIVPVYKVEPYIEQCVDSILAQSFQDFDLVLVDDGSPDSCPQICDAYAEKDTRITVVHKQNGGLSDARNAGIDWAMEHSNSEWLAFVDSDDYLHPDYLRILYDTAQKESADLVVCDFMKVNDAGEKLKSSNEIKKSFVMEDKQQIFEYLYSNWRIRPAWNKLYHKDIFKSLRFCVGKIHEDEFAIPHVLWNCRKIAVVSKVCYYYRIRKNSIMATRTSQSVLDSMEALIWQYEFGLEHRVLPSSVGTTGEYVKQMKEFRNKIADPDLARYRSLLKRFAGVYFSAPSNRNVKRFLGFHFYDLFIRNK